jgi:DUF4097 and DUF4098 domain-containing protein YvlB
MVSRCLMVAGSIALALAVPGPPQTRGAVDLEAADCSPVHMTFGDLAVARAVRHTTVPLSGGRLDVEPETNGGVRIERGIGSNYSITACIGAGASTEAEARQAADATQLAIDGRGVRVKGGRQARNWSVQLIIEAPDGADVTVTTTNGPIDLTGVSGTFDAHASNGPIAIRNVRGMLSAHAQNGPISVEGSQGQIVVETANGPISVVLSGTRWDGRLDAQASNGPLDVKVPSRYQSGVEISSSFHSPWSCRVAACRSGSRDWDERSRSVRIGSDPVVVRISTVNGPVTIDER